MVCNREAGCSRRTVAAHATIMKVPRPAQIAAVLNGFGRTAEGAEIGPDVGAEQPRPDGALVVRAVALLWPAPVLGNVPRFVGSERSQTKGGEEVALHRAHHRLALLGREKWIRQGAPAASSSSAGSTSMP